MKHEIILTDEQETAAQYFADLHSITIEEMIVRDYIDGNLVPAYDEVQKVASKSKYESLPPDSKAIVDTARENQDAELAALIETEHKKTENPGINPGGIDPAISITSEEKLKP